MDGNLFTKHLLGITKKKQEKEVLIIYIQEKTNLLLEENEITISKKQITLTVSSVVLSKLVQKNFKEVLQQKGYTLK